MLQRTDGHGASVQTQTYAPCPPIELDRIPNLRPFADREAALVEALRARTPAAFDDLLKRYGRRLLTLAMRITKNREDAEDVVQDSFLKVFKKIDTFRGASKFSSWLTQIAINQALMLIRRNTQNFVSIDEVMEVGDRPKRPQIAAGGYTPEQLCAQREFEVVMLNLESVRKSSRRVMELRVKHDLSEIEIAQILNLTSSAVKARLYRGRLDLREAMSRRLRSTKLARACKNTSPATAQKTNSVDALSNGKPKQQSSWTSASGLAHDNLLPAQHGRPSLKAHCFVPYPVAPQLLTRPCTLQIGGPEIAIEYAGASEALKNERCP